MPLAAADVDRVVARLGVPAAPTRREGVRRAMAFFARYLPLMSEDQQVSYLRAMDLSRSVDVVDLHRGEEVVAFRYPAREFGEFHSRVGADPYALGILVAGREFRRYTVVDRVPALQSRTSAFVHPMFGSGGGFQLVIPQPQRYLRVVQRGVDRH